MCYENMHFVVVLSTKRTSSWLLTLFSRCIATHRATCAGNQGIQAVCGDLIDFSSAEEKIQVANNCGAMDEYFFQIR